MGRSGPKGEPGADGADATAGGGATGSSGTQAVSGTVSLWARSNAALPAPTGMTYNADGLQNIPSPWQESPQVTGSETLQVAEAFYWRNAGSSTFILTGFVVLTAQAAGEVLQQYAVTADGANPVAVYVAGTHAFYRTRGALGAWTPWIRIDNGINAQEWRMMFNYGFFEDAIVDVTPFDLDGLTDFELRLTIGPYNSPYGTLSKTIPASIIPANTPQSLNFTPGSHRSIRLTADLAGAVEAHISGEAITGFNGVKQNGFFLYLQRAANVATGREIHSVVIQGARGQTTSLQFWAR